DASVKEMSEKIARLASSLETVSEERASFEDKLARMEERMRKLSSLTEMISAQYNPFVGDAPSERDPMPHPEVGLAPPPPPPTAAPPVEAPPALQLAPEFPPLPAAEMPPMPAFDAPHAADPFAAPEPAPHAQPADPSAAPGPADERMGVYLWSVAPSFESSMLLLGWSDMLLKSAGSREALLDLVNYYHNIGWIGDPARDQLLAYADGLALPAASASTDWRADVDVHEKSLLFVEKLRATAARRA
ncbi:MAG TPA: FlaD/FlaE family flagellar protein, partial [Candidatus Thermoplasmatota archaeon]|nr:FlaD/FlaE family flagellar protein [Candidatus Thermoplasmatota archaeon]